MNKPECHPGFIIIGPPKSGTTSLYNYLRQHPDIYLPDKKELHYFSCEYLKKNSNGPGDRDILPRLCGTYQEYESHYMAVKNEQAIGEISPSYFYYSDVSERIFSELGRIKIVAMLRDPVRKAHSQYMHLLREQRETLSFYDALMAEPERMKKGWLDIWYYAESTLYTNRIKKYISVFGKDNVKIVIFENMVNNPDEFMRELFEFLEVDAGISCDTSRVFNKSVLPRYKIVSDILKKPNLAKSILKKIIPQKIRTFLYDALLELNAKKKPDLDSKSIEYLRDYFKADIKELQELIGKKLSWKDSGY